MFVHLACSAASLTALRKALVEKVAPDTASTPEPLASIISGIMISKAISPTCPVSVLVITSMPLISSASNVTLIVNVPL